MEDKFQLVFTSKQLVVLDAALWNFICGFKYDTYNLNDDDFNRFIDSVSNAYELRKYIHSNIVDNEDK